MSASSISALLALTLTAPVGMAQPLSLQHRAPVPEAAEAAPAEAAAAEAPAPEAAPAEAEADPNADISEAQSARQADASAKNWEAEGDALAAKGERGAAIAAYTQALNRADSDEARAALSKKIDEAYAQPLGELPGTEVVETPASEAPAAPAEDGGDPAAAMAVAPADTDAPETPITKRWYFWVTVVAITASAGAITGIATKAAIDERKATRSDVAPGSGPAPAMGPALFRF